MSTRILAAAVIITGTLVLWLASATPTLAQQTGTSTNAPGNANAPQLSEPARDVLKLTKAKLGEEVVLAFVQNDERSYNLSASEVIYLQQEGVSSSVLISMLNKSPSAVAPQPAASVAPVATQPLLTSPEYVSYPAPDYYAFDGSLPYWYDDWPYWYRWHYYWYDPWPYYTWYWWPVYTCGYLWAYHHHHDDYYHHYDNHHPPPDGNRPPPGGARPPRNGGNPTRSGDGSMAYSGGRPSERPAAVSGSSLGQRSGTPRSGTSAGVAAASRPTRGAGTTSTWTGGNVNRPLAASSGSQVAATRGTLDRAAPTRSFSQPSSPYSVSRSSVSVPTSRPSSAGQTTTWTRSAPQMSRSYSPGSYSGSSVSPSLGSSSIRSSGISRPSYSGSSVGSSGISRPSMAPSGGSGFSSRGSYSGGSISSGGARSSPFSGGSRGGVSSSSGGSGFRGGGRR